MYYFFSMESKSEPMVAAGVVIDLDVAELIVKVFLPTNERKMRKAHPSVVAAVTSFKNAVNARKMAR